MNPVVQLQKSGIILAKIIPLKLADKIATVIGLVSFKTLKERRSYIKTNLSYIFSDKAGEAKKLNFYIKNTFINFSHTMVDFFRLGFISKEEIISSVELIGRENLVRGLSYETGCVLITPHLGNWDYAGSFLAAIGFPVSALVEETAPEMFELYTKHRERTGMKTFPISRSGYAFLDAIRNNRVLAVVADRDIMKNGITVNFFSGKRNIPKGLGEIIIKKKLPVLFAYLVLNLPDNKNRYLGVIEPPLLFDGTINEFNCFMVKKFEEFISHYPDQWFVFHPEWIA